MTDLDKQVYDRCHDCGQEPLHLAEHCAQLFIHMRRGWFEMPTCATHSYNLLRQLQYEHACVFWWPLQSVLASLPMCRGSCTDGHGKHSSFFPLDPHAATPFDVHQPLRMALPDFYRSPHASYRCLCLQREQLRAAGLKRTQTHAA